MKRLFLYFSLLGLFPLLFSDCSPKSSRKVQTTGKQNKAESDEVPQVAEDRVEQVANPNVPTVVTTPAEDRVNEPNPTGINNEALTKGKAIWSTSCIKCHASYHPNTRTMAEWKPILNTMTKKAKLNSEEIQQLDVFFAHFAKK